MTALPNRTTLRNDLVTNLKTISWVVTGPVTVTPLADESGITKVFGYWNKNPGGISPFACVDSGSIYYSTSGSSELLTPMVLIIGFWAKRGETDEHDVMLDNLALGLVNILRNKYNATFKSPSISDYEILNGVPHKFELHFVQFDV